MSRDSRVAAAALFTWVLFFLSAAAASNANIVAPDFSPASLKATLASASLGPQIQASERTEAREYIRFRHDQMTLKEKLFFVAGCLARPGENLFCDFVSGKPERKPSSDSKDSARERALAQTLASGSSSGLESVPEHVILRALRAFDSWAPLQKVADQAASSSSCQMAALQTALAQKAEEFFPDPAFRKISLDLYSRAARCNDPETGLKARYRFSLLQIWGGHCDQADSMLQELIDSKDGEFAPRALYWRMHCAQSSGKKLMAESLRRKLLKDYPLNFHTILSSRDKVAELTRILEEQDAAVLFRSQIVPGANPLVRASELLLSEGEAELTAEILERAADQSEAAEPAFRLYLALLLHRAHDPVPAFHLLATVFRDSPSLISLVTLKLFYPLRRFEDVRRYGSQVDPFLVSALIRQESGFNERARSPAGAFGLMQLIPSTARRFERVSRRELFDAKTNIRLGVKVLSKLLDRYHGDVDLALAAYNAGPEKVDDWKRRYATDDRLLFVDLIPFHETRDYVALISRNYYWYERLYDGDFTDGSHRSAGRQLASRRRGKALISTLFLAQ